MLSSIHPLGERAKGNRWAVTATAFVAGCVAGGIAAGGLAGLAGQAVAAIVAIGASTRQALTFAVLAAALVVDAHLFGIRLPTVRRQVDENWLNEYRGWVYGAGYGVQLGLGVVTVVNTAAVYAALALAFLTGSVMGGVLIGAVFGLLRGLAIVPGRRITSPDRLRSFHRSFDRSSRVAAGVALAGEAVVVLVVAGTIVVR